MATINPLLVSLDIKSTDKVISIKENGNIDSNFVITHLIKQILFENNKLCFVILHNTLGHYHNVGKRLGYDFLKQVEEGCIKTIEPLKDIVEDIGNGTNYLIDDKEQIVKALFTSIKNSIEEFTATTPNRAYLIIDDISHLLDLGIDLKYIISFINYCLSLINDDRVSVVINTHVCSKPDEIICNNLNYVSDVVIEVLPLKTGISREVTGVMTIEKSGKAQVTQFHFKAYDKGIKTFHLGESVYNLYK
ncbi:elongator complex protein 6-like [Tribolium madens]|uniref:elongator complex protein 6-like n=1 Tax=Tribolium madens TaxID=41895 RepID=UPI001CF742C6|nr:elongator complex protein 6-like [Tribolium madens]